MKLPVARLLSVGNILILAALLRVASIPLVHNFVHPKTWEFGPLAKSLASGFGYSDRLPDETRVPAIYMPPAYSYFLAGFYWVLGDKSITYVTIEIIQAGLGVLLVYLVYRLAILVIGERHAIAAAFIAAIYPAQIYMCNEFHGISIYIVLGVATVFFLARYLQISNSWRDICSAAVCGGLLMLFRGEAPALIVMYGAILIIVGRRKAVAAAAAFVLIAYACLCPWVVRNYREFHRIILVCASGGENLWIGNNARATGSQHYSLFDPMPADVKSALAGIPPGRYYDLEKDRALERLALYYIRTHPSAESRLMLRKVWMFFVFDSSHEKGSNPMYWMPSLVLTLIAIWGVRLRGAELLSGPDLLLAASIAFTVLIATIFFVLPRYKIAVDPFLMIIAANVINRERLAPRNGTGMLMDPGYAISHVG
jgi:hypothetical protein